MNKPANANAMFLLKARHGYREFDSAHAKVDVAVTMTNVLVVKDHGTNEEWVAKVAEQQRQLIIDNGHQPQIEATVAEPIMQAPVKSFAAPAWKSKS